MILARSARRLLEKCLLPRKIRLPTRYYFNEGTTYLHESGAMKMSKTVEIIRNSSTSRNILSLLILLFAAQSLYGQEANVSTRDKNLRGDVRFSNDPSNYITDFSSSYPVTLDKPVEIKHEVRKRLGKVENQAIKKMEDASKSLGKAQENFKRASSSEHLPTNVIKRLGPKKTLKQLEGTKKTLTADIERTNMSIKNQQNKLTASDESLAREYTRRKNDEIIKHRNIVTELRAKKDVLVKANAPFEIRSKAVNSFLKAEKALKKLSPGELNNGIDPRSTTTTRFVDGHHYTKNGMTERAKLQREHLGTKISNAEKVVADKSPELKTVKQQITAIKDRNAAQQAVEKAKGQLARANQEVLGIKTGAELDIAREKLAERQESLKSAVKTLNGAGTRLNTAIAEYDNKHITIKTFAGYLGFLSKLAGELEEDPDPTKALEIGEKLLEAAADNFFPKLESLPKDSKGNYVFGKTDKPFARIAELNLSEMVEALEAMKKANKILENLWDQLKDAEDNFTAAEKLFVIARREAILQQLEQLSDRLAASPTRATLEAVKAERSGLLKEFETLGKYVKPRKER